MENVAESTTAKRPLWRRKWPWIVLAAAAAFVALVGPWPSYSSSYEGTEYASATFARLDALPLAPTTGPLIAGAAAKDITPPVGEPMAGFSARKPKTGEGVHDNLFAKAISLSNGRKTVTIVGGDILLVLPELRDAVLQRLNLPREEVYFTATHTHSGPGGYSSRWVDQMTLGEFDRAILTRLADAFAEVIRQSRSNMRPAEIDLRAVHPRDGGAGEYVANRIAGDSPAFGTLHALTIRTDHGAMAIAVVASPHPTCLGADNRLLSGDYPGVVQRAAEKDRQCTCMFLAGAVGSMRPADIGESGFEQAESVGGRIWARAKPDGTPGGPSLPQVTLAASVLEVDLPPQQYLLGKYLRVSPVAASYLHGRRTYVQVLRINQTVFLGMPCDYSGELAAELERACAGQSLFPVITSFNGDYIGYLLPHDRYAKASYETRDLNLFGPWCGEYFNEIAVRLLRRSQVCPGAVTSRTRPGGC